MMNKSTGVALLAVWLILTVSVAKAEASLKTNGVYPAVNATWQFTPAPSRVSLYAPADSPLETVQFRLRDAQGNALQPEREESSADIIREVYPDGLTISHQLSSRGPALVWRMTFANQSDHELLFEPALIMKVNVPEATYYDGYRVVPWKQNAHMRDTLMNTYPVAAVIAEGNGFAFGSAPNIATSYLANGIDADGTAYYLSRVALPPGKSCELAFVLFPFTGEHAQYDTMAVYQQSFPEVFRPTPGVDPRLTGGKVTNGHYETNRFGGINTPIKSKYTGQGYVGLCWAYAFYRRQGDYFGRPEFWEFDPPLSAPEAEGMANKAKTELNVLDLEAMHRDRIEVFRTNDLRGNTASAFYQINTVDKGIIRDGGMEKYVYPMLQGQPAYQGWALGYGVSGHIYPWGTPYEDILRRDIPEIMRESDMSAIAYDGFADLDAPNPIALTELYRGELREYLPGWSYDDKGKFIRLSIGLQHHADFFHATRERGKTLGLWANLWWTNTLLAFKPDAYLYENFDQNSLSGQYYDMLRRGLYFRGHRPAYIHNVEFESWISRSIPWQEIPGDVLRLAFEDCVREVITTLYQTNLIPVWEMVLTQKDIFDEMPYLTELSERGFYAPCPSQGDPALERVRYGQGLNALLVLSNKERAPKAVAERIDNRYLGDFHTLPVSYRREKELPIHFEGDKSVFSAILTPQENLLVAVPVALKTTDTDIDKLQVLSRMTHDAYQKVYTYDFDAAAPVAVQFEFLDDPHFQLLSAVLDDQPLSADHQVDLPAGRSRLVVTAHSKLFAMPEKSLAAFPWERAAIVTETGAGERERGTALMLQDYLICAFGHTGATIVETDPGDGTPLIVLRTGAASRIAVTDGDCLEISAPDAFALQQNVWQLLRLQDRTNPRVAVSYGPIMEPAEMRERMLDGNQTPFVARDTEQRVEWSSLVRGKSRSTLAFGYENQLSVPVLTRAPALNGDLSDPVWEQAARIDDFRQLGSQVPARYRTEARLLRAGDDLFVAFKCFEPEMGKLSESHTLADSPLWENDDVELRLAPGIAGDDFRRYPFYNFLVSSSGVQADILQYPREMDADAAQIVAGPAWERRPFGSAWNAEWEVKSSKQSESWIVEMRIPLKQLQHDATDQWRILLGRGEKPHGENSCWPVVPEGLFDNSIYFGSMTFKDAE